MSTQEVHRHITVLLNEAVAALNIRENGVYVDGTFGRGGHSKLILSKLGSQGRLVVFDKDPQAIAVANELAAQDKRVCVVHNGFATFQTALDELGIEKIDGALFDLGISSPQIDERARGFICTSFSDGFTALPIKANGGCGKSASLTAAHFGNGACCECCFINCFTMRSSSE